MDDLMLMGIFDGPPKTLKQAKIVARLHFRPSVVEGSLQFGANHGYALRRFQAFLAVDSRAYVKLLDLDEKSIHYDEDSILSDKEFRQLPIVMQTWNDFLRRFGKSRHRKRARTRLRNHFCNYLRPTSVGHKVAVASYRSFDTQYKGPAYRRIVKKLLKLSSGKTKPRRKQIRAFLKRNARWCL